jgi:hypothetical protein
MYFHPTSRQPVYPGTIPAVQLPLQRPTELDTPVMRPQLKKQEAAPDAQAPSVSRSVAETYYPVPGAQAEQPVLAPRYVPAPRKPFNWRRVGWILATLAAWAPLTFTDENPPAPPNPVAPARRSARAQAKASCQYDPAGQPYRSFRGLIDHLATLPRNQVRFAGTQATVLLLTEPTSTQREAFSPLGAAIPLTLT